MDESKFGTGNATVRIMIRSYRDLIVWQRAMELAESCYRIGATLPTDERYGLVDQIRRSAVSIPANIAEGHGRLHRGDYLRFLSIARGSLAELRTLLLLSARLHHADISTASMLAGETSRMLSTLIRHLRASPRPRPLPDP